MSTPSEHKIGLTVATIIGMNAMIGAGIFGVPAALASNVGPAGIITYIFVIIAVWFMGSSIARLAQLFPQEGSFYIYTKQWGGHIMGLIAAGSYLVGLVIAMGLLSQVAGSYLHTYFPFFSPFVCGLLTLILLTLLNMAGVVLSEAGQIILICTTVFPLIATTILCLTKARISNLFPFMPFGLSNIFTATKAVIFGFFGFECAASLFSIVKDPEKNVSRALTLAIALVGTLYILFVSSLILAIPLHHFSVSIPLSETLRIIFPENKWIIAGIHLSILSAVLGTIHSMIWSSSALLISYFKQFKRKKVQYLISHGFINQRSSVAIIACCIGISFLILKDIDLFFSFTAFFLILAFAFSMITLLTIKKEWQSWNNIKTLIGLGTASIIVYFAIEEIVKRLF
jgi:APA family basic amino acid/polyamine antiporter